MGLLTGALPDFPWDTLVPFAERAMAHPDGIVDLSVGTPVDPTPELVQEALAAAADAPGYPTTHGTLALREAVAAWFARRRGVPGLDPAAVLPTVGSKELVAWLPALLGLGAGDVVVHPRTAYPTYDVGARLAGATPLPADDVAVWAGRPDVRLVWVNSPANPTGQVLGVDELRAVVAEARRAGAVVASDECYALLAWDEPWAGGGVPSILDPAVCDGDHTGLLAVHSLSKQSNLAGYRAAFVAGDRALVSRLLEVRKHAGMMVPAPVQAAMVAALDDDAHVAEQRARYGRRRRALRDALEGAGFEVDGSAAGLYLWTRAAGAGQDCWRTVADLADLGILVAPGAFYGPAGARHVRIALTASDESVARAVARLTGA
ncbi:succinyldiaminopimelate transaminase [Actinotalea sp.]|uniref:succinyldiaminopimelate transaminase n=1 Tax=Actinotalea sp. TaxID=1872145 RepID=UPI002C036D24|nr:succinyldiaminopimelate transaminase [Actinotalea sp.]HQY33105.1 succinyldiaminopimelate transaminase [Actinotalea sp.]HRA51671.1 succinyldiaminopimelate transaminase [Actinotalea sp.]